MRRIVSTSLAIVLFLLASEARSQSNGARPEPPVLVVPARTPPAEIVRSTGRIVAVKTALIGARVAGHIVLWGDEGDAAPDVGVRVKAGRRLFRVDPTVYEGRVGLAEADLASASARLADIKAGTRPERIQALKAEAAEIAAKIDALERDEARWRRLVEDDKTAAPKRLEDIRSEITVAKARAAAAAARLAEAEAGATASQIAVLAAAVRVAEANARLAAIELADTVVRAPFDGVITRRMRSLGDYVGSQPFVEVLELTADDVVEAEIRFPEQVFGRVEVGKTEIEIVSPLLSEPLRVAVDRTAGVIASADGAFLVRCTIPPEKRQRLAPGAFVEARGRFAPPPGALVPADAVVRSQEETHVFLVREDRAIRVPIVLGERVGADVAVKSGIVPGDRVVAAPGADFREGPVVLRASK